MSGFFLTSFSEPDEKVIPLPAQGNWAPSVHRFTRESLWALDMAILTGRPLLIRGEPGIGKSQIARAAAQVLKVPFLSRVVDERTERDDLLYHYDAVARLALAQVSSLAAQGESGEKQSKGESWRESLQEQNFFRPGVLWWALDWKNATDQARLFSQHCRPCNPPGDATHLLPESTSPCGPVVLIDEIDKADPAVPNGLLECLGSDGFYSSHLDRTVSVPPGGKRPLVILTTNEERELPAAFLRRCLVTTVEFPEETSLAEKFLIDDRARVRFDQTQISDNICKKVVSQVLGERAQVAKQRTAGIARPGASEFLDLISALVMFADQSNSTDRDSVQSDALEVIWRFALQKAAKD
jgi:MoxR-like ATPase